ncbi:FUSC family protein [Magnetospirillum molischianum]|nr:FUSC family protein [Magnetospirillum molischianum]
MKSVLNLDAIRRSLALSRATKAIIVVLLSYSGGLYFTGLLHPESALFGAMWAAVSGLASMQDDLPGTRDAAALRVWGTLVGALVAASYLSVLPFSMIGLALAAGLAAGIGALFKLTDGGRLSAITVTVISILTVINPDLHPISNASLRFLESCFGSAMALVVALTWTGIGRLWRYGKKSR